MFKAAAILVFTLSTLTFASPAYAVDSPNPQPCKNPIPSAPEDLVDNYITEEDGTAITDLKWQGANSLQVTGAAGQVVNLPPVTFNFRIDFSKLQALFASTSSNYLEGKVQDGNHRNTDISNLNSQDLNTYYGVIQKTTPKIVIDEQKRRYVEYVYNKPTLPEAANTYTDIHNQGTPQTVYDLVNAYGMPEPQNLNDDWKRYWQKIPTTWSEFYEGEIAFDYVLGNKGLELLKKNNDCPKPGGDTIKFVLPEFFRTTAISDQLNRQIVPKVAQSFEEHGILAQKPQHENILAKARKLCWELIKNSTTNLKKAVKISLEKITPINTIYADIQNQSCLKNLSSGKEGTAPYCPLPLTEATKPGVTCSNKNDSYKLEQDNPNVICTFTRTLSASVLIDPNLTVANNPDNAIFDSCIDIGGGNFTCTVPLQIFPNIRIPWIAAIWNNTLFSDETEHLDNQETGRPGIFGIFTPKAISNPLNTNLSGQDIIDFCDEGTNNETPLCQKLGEEFSECLAAGKGFEPCLGQTLKLPANVPNSSQQDPKERFVGGVDCGKNFVKDIALKPKILQEALGIKASCNLAASATSGGGSSTNPDVGHPGAEGDCSGKYTIQYPTQYLLETGNFGDPACDYSESQLYTMLQNQDPANADYWYFTVVNCESSYNPNSFRHHIEPGAADTPDPDGAWGLFQMGRGLNGPLDHGDVPWQEQIQNAVSYKNDELGGSFAYWACAAT